MSTIDVPDEVVAMFRYPIPVDTLSSMVRGLERAYGKGLVIRLDEPGVSKWMVIARPGAETS